MQGMQGMQAMKQATTISCKIFLSFVKFFNQHVINTISNIHHGIQSSSACLVQHDKGHLYSVDERVGQDTPSMVW
jgi:hypothetical protein